MPGNQYHQRKIGIILSYLFLLVNTVVNLAYVPILVTYIGIDEFGLYKLLGSIIAYFNVLDFGLSTTIVKFLSEYLELDKKETIKELLSTVSILCLIISIVLCFVSIIIYYNIPLLFKETLSESMIISAQQILLLLFFNIILLFNSKIFDAIIVSHERFIFLKIVSILQVVLQPFVVIAVIFWYPTALYVVLVQSLFNTVLIFIKWSYCRYILHTKISYCGCNKSIIKALYKLSISLFVVAVVDQVFWQSNQILLGLKVGTAAVAVYAVASQIYINYMNISTAMSGVLLPKITMMVARRESDKAFQHIFIKVGRLQFYLLSLILTGFVIFGHDFLHYWAGENFRDAYWIALIVMIPFTIDLIQNIGLIIMQARNVYHIRAIIYFFMGIANIILAVWLIRDYGILGGAVATGTCMFIGNGLLMNWYYHCCMKINIVVFWREIAKIAFVALAVMTVAYLLWNYFFIRHTVIAFCISIVIYISFFFALQWYVNFNEYEKNLFISVKLKLLRNL